MMVSKQRVTVRGAYGVTNEKVPSTRACMCINCLLCCSNDIEFYRNCGTPLTDGMHISFVITLDSLLYEASYTALELPPLQALSDVRFSLNLSLNLRTIYIYAA